MSSFAFVKESHNATWKSEDSLVKAGRMSGNAILMAFAVECALKALLEIEGKPITKELQKHALYLLFTKLPSQTQSRVSSVYESFVRSEQDIRVRSTPISNLVSCLRTHDAAFINWRYNIGKAGSFYLAPMMYACVSLLTFVFPQERFVVGSGTLPDTVVMGGKINP